MHARVWIVNAHTQTFGSSPAPLFPAKPTLTPFASTYVCPLNEFVYPKHVVGGVTRMREPDRR
jgi:hypothetical protein